MNRKKRKKGKKKKRGGITELFGPSGDPAARQVEGGHLGVTGKGLWNGLSIDEERCPE